MEYFIIKGKNQLNGDYQPQGNKNAALPIIAACLLVKSEILLKNVPEIEDVKNMLKLCESLGAKIQHTAKNQYIINAQHIKNTVIDSNIGKQIRTSLLFAGPLLARMGHADIPKPGGDSIGKRRIDTHFLALEKLGVTISVNNTYTLTCKKLKGSFIYLDEASVTGTENAMLASVNAEGHTTIYNAACEPHVQDLCNFLNSCGAKIDGIGTNKLIIQGVTNLHGTEWSIVSDFMEIGSIIGLAAISSSELRIHNIIPDHYIIIRNYYQKLGIDFIFDNTSIIVPKKQQLVVRNDLDHSIPVISDNIWPGFPTDLTSIAVVMATQVQGTVLVFEKMFENRLFFTDKLVSLGARIVMCDPHRVVISGPTPLYAGDLTSPDIRAGMAMLIATLIAEGISRIYNIKQIDRGYEQIDQKLNALGASIQRVIE